MARAVRPSRAALCAATSGRRSTRVISNDGWYNARIFIQREAKYLRERNQAAAENFLGRLRQARRNLAQFPRIGHEKTSLPIEGALRLVVGDYILDYDLDDEGVAITAIRHGRQQDPDLDKDEDCDFEADTSRASPPKK